MISAHSHSLFLLAVGSLGGTICEAEGERTCGGSPCVLGALVWDSRQGVHSGAATTAGQVSLMVMFNLIFTFCPSVCEAEGDRTCGGGPCVLGALVWDSRQGVHTRTATAFAWILVSITMPALGVFVVLGVPRHVSKCFIHLMPRQLFLAHTFYAHIHFMCCHCVRNPAHRSANPCCLSSVGLASMPPFFAG